MIVNGTSCGFIPSGHGLRQGDPLSPAMFILASEYFSRGLNKLFADNPSMFFSSHCSVSISHLSYADECIVFCNGQKSGLQKLMIFFNHYEQISGKKLSVEKSNIFLGKRANSSLINQLTGFSVSSLPFTYLGAPIS